MSDFSFLVEGYSQTIHLFWWNQNQYLSHHGYIICEGALSWLAIGTG